MLNFLVFWINPFLTFVLRTEKYIKGLFVVFSYYKMAYKIKVKRMNEEQKNKLVIDYYDSLSMKVYGKKYHLLNGKESSFIREYSYKSLKK